MKFEIGNLKLPRDTEADQPRGDEAPLGAVKSPGAVDVSGRARSPQPEARSLPLPGLEGGPFYSPREVSRILPGHVSKWAVVRWVSTGVLAGPKGRKRKVFLKAWRIGGRLTISQRDLLEFLEATRPAAPAANHARITARRPDDSPGHRRAMEQLKALGVV